MSLSRDHFEYVREVVRREAAIVLDDNKEYLVEMRLNTLAQKEGIGGVAELISDVRDRRNTELKDLMVQAMTTNETSFFRDRHPFDAMRDSVLPELIEKRAARRDLKIWCAAASTGQEPYSLAMLLQEALSNHPGWTGSILGTDISNEVLAKARAGVYSQHEVGRGMPAQYLVRNFKREGLNWQIQEGLKELVEFRRMNLIEPWVGLPTFDVIFIRNVLIYFDPPTKRQILTNAVKHLAPDGYLFLGGSETLLGLDLDFERILLGNVAAYRPAN